MFTEGQILKLKSYDINMHCGSEEGKKSIKRLMAETELSSQQITVI